MHTAHTMKTKSRKAGGGMGQQGITQDEKKEVLFFSTKAGDYCAKTSFNGFLHSRLMSLLLCLEKILTMPNPTPSTGPYDPSNSEEVSTERRQCLPRNGSLGPFGSKHSPLLVWPMREDGSCLGHYSSPSLT